MGDTPCQAAQFRVRKDWLVSQPSTCHSQPGIVPLRPNGGGLACRQTPGWEEGGLPPHLSPAWYAIGSCWIAGTEIPYGLPMALES